MCIWLVGLLCTCAEALHVYACARVCIQVQAASLQTLRLQGCAHVNDSTLSFLAQHCTNLRELGACKSEDEPLARGRVCVCVKSEKQRVVGRMKE